MPPLESTNTIGWSTILNLEVTPQPVIAQVHIIYHVLTRTLVVLEFSQLAITSLIYVPGQIVLSQLSVQYVNKLSITSFI